MGNSILVKSIQSLEQFRVSLKRYQHDTLGLFVSVEMKVRIVRERLFEQEQYWNKRLVVRTEKGTYIDKAAEAELQRIRIKKNRLEAAYNVYKKDSGQLKTVLENDLNKGVSLLDKGKYILNTYLHIKI